MKRRLVILLGLVLLLACREAWAQTQPLQYPTLRWGIQNYASVTSLSSTALTDWTFNSSQGTSWAMTGGSVTAGPVGNYGLTTPSEIVTASASYNVPMTIFFKFKYPTALTYGFLDAGGNSSFYINGSSKLIMGDNNHTWLTGLGPSTSALSLSTTAVQTVAFTIDSGYNFKYYLNGNTPDASSGTTSTFNYTSQNLLYNGGGGAFTGLTFFEWGLWNRALSSTEIGYLCNNWYAPLQVASGAGGMVVTVGATTLSSGTLTNLALSGGTNQLTISGGTASGTLISGAQPTAGQLLSSAGSINWGGTIITPTYQPATITASNATLTMGSSGNFNITGNTGGVVNWNPSAGTGSTIGFAGTSWTAAQILSGSGTGQIGTTALTGTLGSDWTATSGSQGIGGKVFGGVGGISYTGNQYITGLTLQSTGGTIAIPTAAYTISPNRVGYANTSGSTGLFVDPGQSNVLYNAAYGASGGSGSLGSNWTISSGTQVLSPYVAGGVGGASFTGSATFGGGGATVNFLGTPTGTLTSGTLNLSSGSTGYVSGGTLNIPNAPYVLSGHASFSLTGFVGSSGSVGTATLPYSIGVLSPSYSAITGNNAYGVNGVGSIGSAIIPSSSATLTGLQYGVLTGVSTYSNTGTMFPISNVSIGGVSYSGSSLSLAGSTSMLTRSSGTLYAGPQLSGSQVWYGSGSFQIGTGSIQTPSAPVPGPFMSVAPPKLDKQSAFRKRTTVKLGETEIVIEE